MEDVEDVIVSSGPNTWPNWRTFSDRIIQPGDIVFMDGLRSPGTATVLLPHYRVGKEPSQEQKDTYETALRAAYDSIGAVKVGATTRDIALKWPSAMETWGWTVSAAANGVGLGLAQYDPPVISRIWSLDHPVEIKGMTFALETQRQALPLRRAHREMPIVHKDADRDRLQFPVKQITVVDPIRAMATTSMSVYRKTIVKAAMTQFVAC
jgi:Xaa-Pro dipeptidase